MKKNVASSTPNSKQKQNINFSQDHSQKQMQISQFNSTEDQSQSDLLKNDESIISNDLSQPSNNFVFTQEIQDNRDNQIEFINNEDDIKNNQDQSFIIQNSAEKINHINNQNQSPLINENLENQQTSLQYLNQEIHQNPYQQDSHQFNMIEQINQEQIQEIKNERFSYSNKKALTVEIEDNEFQESKLQIEQQNKQIFENETSFSNFQFNLNQQKTNSIIDKQYTEHCLDDNYKFLFSSQDEDFLKQDNLQIQKIEENRQDIEIVNDQQIFQINDNSKEKDEAREIQRTCDEQLKRNSLDKSSISNELKIQDNQINQIQNQEIKQMSQDSQILEQKQQEYFNVENFEFNKELEIQIENQKQNYFEHEKNNNQNQEVESNHQDQIIFESEDQTDQFQNSLEIQFQQVIKDQQLQSQQKIQDFTKDENNLDGLFQNGDDNSNYQITQEVFQNENKIEQSQINQFSFNNQIEEEQDKIICIEQSREDQEFNEINQQLQNKESEQLNQNEQIISEGYQRVIESQVEPEKNFDQKNMADQIHQESIEAEQSIEKNDQQEVDNITLEISKNILEELKHIKNQDSDFTKFNDIDLNNNDIQQQVNKQDIEINNQNILQEIVHPQIQQQELKSEDHKEEHQVQNQCQEDFGICNKELIEEQKCQNLDQNVIQFYLNCNDQEMEQIQQQAKNVFQPQINNFSEQNQKMNQDIEQKEDHQKDQNLQQNKQKSHINIQQDSELVNRVIDNQSESNKKQQPIILIDHSDAQGFSDQYNHFKPDQNADKKGFERKNIIFSSQQKKNQQGENFFLSQTKIQNQEDVSNQNPSCNSQSQHLKEYSSSKSNDYNNIDVVHGGDQNKDYADELQEQRKQKIRELELQILQAQREIDEKDEKIKQNQEMITTFESFILQDYNPEEFEKIILSESNFETDNMLITNLIKKLRQFLQDFQDSIIDLITRFDGKTELDKDEEGEKDRDTKVHDKHLNVITKEFKKFIQKQQKKDLEDNKGQIINQDHQKEELRIANKDLDSLISSIIGQTKLLRDILQKSCCLIIKFNCEMYNGLQGMSKNKSQIAQIVDLTKTVRQITQKFQQIINEQVDLQELSADNDQILLLELLKQLIYKQEEAKKFQQLFTECLFQRIDLVQQSEQNLREDMARMLQQLN
ncbi:unnamed protein product [Paramecium sonneborni]|uniref:Uncharacterized protein n=1 Tax=Paramecium sonneborni TaxID=65129 RepID=A0A8S1NMI2_9CILI|nr:unnamed protein product [Paramecium sonneborni]